MKDTGNADPRTDDGSDRHDGLGRGPCAVCVAPFGILPDGRPAHLFTMVNGNGMLVRVTDYGGIVTGLLAPDRDGRSDDVVLGHDSLAPYLCDPYYLGALIGRYGNRIADARFALGGRAWQLDRNDRAHHLHGGGAGFHTRLWSGSMFRTSQGAGVELRYRSVHGEQGYPGNLDVTVRYELDEANTLSVLYSAVTDMATPVNLTQHSYFNLAGEGGILEHELCIAAQRYTPVDAGLIPLGGHAALAGTPFDFRAARPIGARIDADDPQLRLAGGYDHNFVLDTDGSAVAGPAARVRAPESGRVLELYTSEPGLQFYSGNFLDGSLDGKGRSLTRRGGFCLEPQHFPDSPNRPAFPSTILRPGELYRSVSRYVFSVDP